MKQSELIQFREPDTAALPRRLRHHVAVGPTNLVRGWICDDDRPDEPLSVRIVLEQRWGLPPIDVGVQTANLSTYVFDRPGGNAIPVGFECRVPFQWDATKIRAFELTTNLELDGSPMHFGVAPQFEGYFDGVTEGSVRGWAWAARPDYRCDIDVFIDSRYVATVYATEPRADLAAVGLGSGSCGFFCPIPLDLLDGGEHEIGCIFHGTRRHLNQSPARVRLSLLDTFAALGDDGVLRGTITSGAMRDAEQLMLDVLLDHRPVSKLVAHRSPSIGAAVRPGRRSFDFAVPAPLTAGVIEIAPSAEVISAVTGIKRRQSSAQATHSNGAVAGPRARVEMIDEALPVLPALNCRHVAATEWEWIARRQQESALQGRKSKLLIPVWGESYIAMFCELCLPSLLSNNNLPKYTEQHELTVVILTRSSDISMFDDFTAIARLRDLADIAFISIDDILESFFDPKPESIYSIALTYAFYRGITSSGDEATSTDFIFWNADFLASDGTFATLADIVARGSRCTMSASLRTDLSALDALRDKLSADGTQLSIAPRDLVRIALKHPHPTVDAQTLNRHPDRLLSTIINRLCWQVTDDVLIGRFFLLFMLHIRPERVCDDVNGPCDYTFVPELVPNAEIVYECNSDRMCIIEPQHSDKEAWWINSEPLDIAKVAKWIDYWATYEHVAYSKNLVVFNGSRHAIEEIEEFDAAVATLDRFMSELYLRLGEERLWHNLHVYWRSTYEVVEREVPRPNPDRPRSRTANIARWTGYDLDVIKDSWGDPTPNLRELFAACPDPGAGGGGAMSRWLDDLFDTYVSAWLSDPLVRLVDQNPISLVYIHQRTSEQRVVYDTEFYGCRWGPAEQHDGAWYRLLGPGGGAILLHRTTQRHSFMIELKGLCFGAADPRDLLVTINGAAPSGRVDQNEGEHFTIRLYLRRGRVIECAGRMVINIVDAAYGVEHVHARFGFSGYSIEPDDGIDRELELIADAGVVATAVSSAARQIVDVAPSLMRLRDLNSSPIPIDGIEVDFAQQILGCDWPSPFNHRGSRLRWAEGKGGELLVVRVRPECAYRVEFAADRSLSLRELIIGCAIEANGAWLPQVQIEVAESEYRVTARLTQHCTSQYGGWVAVRLVAKPGTQTTGLGRIEYGEPADGGIAVMKFRARPLSDSDAAVEPIDGRKPSIDTVAVFWKRYVTPFLPAGTSHSGPRRQACRLVGVDYRWYEAAVRHYGGRVAASWVLCQSAVAADELLASDWLDCVDREIAAAWRERGGRASDGDVELTVQDGLEGAGFGEFAHSSDGLGRWLPHGHATRVFLRLSAVTSWTIEFQLHRDEDVAPLEGLEVRLEDRPVETIITSLGTHALRVAIAVSDTALDSFGESVVVTIAEPAHSDRLGTISLIGLQARANTASVSQSRKPFHNPDLASFNRAARQFGVDPAPYIAASEHSAPELLEALVACPDLEPSAPEFARGLFSYLDRALTSAIRLNTNWQDRACEIGLLRDFDGIGWGEVRSFAGHAARGVGPLGRAAIFLHAAAGGAVELTLDCVVDSVGPDLHPITLSVNGKSLHCEEQIIDEHASRLRAMWSLRGKGNLVLQIGVALAAAQGVGFRSISFRRAAHADPNDSVEACGEGGAALAAVAGLRFPAEAADLERLPGIAMQDVILWRFGRDPGLYRSWLDSCGEPLRKVFDSPPAGITWPAPATQAWLDLVDRTFVEALIANRPAVNSPCGIFGAVYGLGWGPVTFRSGALARTLSGAGDAMLFVPPMTSANYAVQINFAIDSDRQTLLALRATANRRATVKQSLIFSEDGPQLRVEIDPSITDFGMGWVAVRLSLGESDDAAVGISFRSSAAVADWDVAVHAIELVPLEDASHAASTAAALLPSPGARSGARSGRRRGGELPTAIHCIVPVWGAEYLRTFLSSALPAHLASGNLSALRMTKLIYEIYTDPIGRRTIEQHDLYPSLVNAVDKVIFSDIQEFHTEERHVHQLNLNYSIMNKSHQAAIRHATAHGGALLFLNCDTVYSERVFARIWALCKQGYRAVENLSIRTDRDQMLAALDAYKRADGILDISSPALTALALPRFHAIARNRFWEGPPDLTIPDHIYWRVAEAAILAHATHYMPLFVFPRGRDVQYLGTIDHGFIPASGVLETERWFMSAQDEPSSYELSLAQHDQRFKPYERGSPRDLARFLSQLCESFHLHNLDRPVRIAAHAVPEERWCEVEQASTQIVLRIRERLQKYVLTAWRPDTAAEADECERVWTLDAPSRRERQDPAEIALVT
jgi:hypothetical protein